MIKRLKCMNHDDVMTLSTAGFKFLLFNLIWGAATTFTGLSLILTWVNWILFSLLFSMPYVAFNKKTLQIILFFLLDALIISNLIYSRTYYGIIPADSYLEAGHGAQYMGTVLDSLSWWDALFPLSTIGLWVIYARSKAGNVIHRKWYWLSLAGSFLISITITLIHGGLVKYYDELSNYKYHAARVHAFGIPGCVIYDIAKGHEPLTPEMQKQVDDYISSTPTLEPLAVETRDNLVLIICESLENWVINHKAENKEITPFLNSLVQDSTTLYLPHVQSQIGDSHSMDCQLMLNAGLLPLKQGGFSINFPDNHFFTLTKAMKEIKGAKSYGLSPDKHNAWNQGEIFKSFGVDNTYFRDDWDNNQPIGTHGAIGDEALMKQIVGKMQSDQVWPQGETAFVQVVTMSGHNPFKLPEKYDNLHLKGNYPDVMGDYMTMAHFTDRSLANLIKYIQSRPDYHNTLIVITGDHEGLASHRKDILTGLNDNDPVIKDISQLFVPVIILNSPVPGRMENVVGQIDIYPTLLQLMGLTGYKWHGLGHSVLEKNAPTFALSSQGQEIGDIKSTNDTISSRIHRARDISDIIIRHNLLKNK